MKPPQYYSRFSRTAATQGGNLPHWSQWCATFTTFRLADSLPEGKLEQMRAERDAWLLTHCGRGVLSASNKDEIVSSCDAVRHRVHDASPCGRGVLSASLSASLSAACDAVRHRVHDASPCGRGVLSASLSAADRAEYRELFSKRFHAWLDAGHGSCILRDAEARSVVEDTLRHFADVRYSLYAFVVMPNHVHVLFMPEEGFDSREIVAGWKRFSSHAVNRLLGRKGSLWQKESYDHLVRDVDEFNAYRSYIRQNDQLLAFDAYAV